MKKLSCRARVCAFLDSAGGPRSREEIARALPDIGKKTLSVALCGLSNEYRLARIGRPNRFEYEITKLGRNELQVAHGVVPRPKRNIIRRPQAAVIADISPAHQPVWPAPALPALLVPLLSSPGVDEAPAS